MRLITQKIVRWTPAGGRLLDIGCGNGTFFDIVHREADRWEFFGSEADPRWQNYDYHGAKVTHRPLRQCDFPTSFFDVITILDAIYYIPDLDKEMAEVARIVKPGGLLVFDVPGLLYLRIRGFVGWLSGREDMYAFSAYPFYFSDRALQLLLEPAKFEVIERLVDQGIVHQPEFLQRLISVYTMFTRLITKIFPVLLPMAPKLIYIAQWRGNE